MKIGVQQECKLSPVLFLIYVNKIDKDYCGFVANALPK